MPVRRDQLKSLSAFAAWVAFLMAVVAVSLWVDAAPPPARLGEWLARADASEIALIAARCVAAALAASQLVVTVVYAAACVLRLPPAALRSIEWALLPVSRRVVQRVAASCFSLTMLAGPAAAAHAQSPSPVPVVIDASGRAGIAPPAANLPVAAAPTTTAPAPTTTAPAPTTSTTTSTTAAPVTTLPAAVSPLPTPGLPDMSGGRESPPSAPPAPSATTEATVPHTAPAAEARTYVVARGDNLWRIARTTIESSGPATTSEVRNYWVSLIEANRQRLRSGDPNLIFPGEALLLPPTGNAA